MRGNLFSAKRQALYQRDRLILSCHHEQRVYIFIPCHGGPIEHFFCAASTFFTNPARHNVNNTARDKILSDPHEQDSRLNPTTQLLKLPVSLHPCQLVLTKIKERREEVEGTPWCWGPERLDLVGDRWKGNAWTGTRSECCSVSQKGGASLAARRVSVSPVQWRADPENKSSTWMHQNTADLQLSPRDKTSERHKNSILQTKTGNSNPEKATNF